MDLASSSDMNSLPSLVFILVVFGATAVLIVSKLRRVELSVRSDGWPRYEASELKPGD